MVEALDKKERTSGKILEYERYWVDRYGLLKRNGYLLRPRYQPGFKPNSEETTLTFSYSSVLDAVQTQDGRKVCLKRMSATETMRTRELALVLEGEPGNHCAPIINFISTGENEERIAVMPMLRHFDSPPFTTVGEALEAVTQFLEGLEFIHNNQVAHRDACAGNMMMDATELIPGGWHIVRPWTRDGHEPITSVPRSSLPTVKYYFIDYGLSVPIDPSEPEPTATGIVGQDKTVPEFTGPEATYNPLKLDIYQLGNAFRTRLLNKYDGLEFLLPLVLAMTSQDPSSRPTATQARDILEIAGKDADVNTPITLKPSVESLDVPEDTRGSRLTKAAVQVKVHLLEKFHQAVGALKRLFRS